MIAIHSESGGFHERWANYCRKKNIAFRRVNMFAPDLVAELNGITAVMWHHSQTKARDVVVARQILFALEHAGIPVFPDFKTAWHFDDKLAQHYLFAFAEVPCARSVAFYSKKEAMQWAGSAEYPKVFKLRNGAGANTVSLIRSKQDAHRVISKAFGRGFNSFNGPRHLFDVIKKEGWKGNRKYILKALYRAFVPPAFARVRIREWGYVLFQDFIPNTGADFKVIVVGDKAIAMKRLVRENDFRASGSGRLSYAKEDISNEVIAVAFDAAQRLGTQCAGFDVVEGLDGTAYVIEVSYGWVAKALDACTGYWDKELQWHEGHYTVQDWILEEFLQQIAQRSLVK